MTDRQRNNEADTEKDRRRACKYTLKNTDWKTDRYPDYQTHIQTARQEQAQ